MFPPIEDLVTPEALAAMPSSQRATWEGLLRQREEGKRILDAHIADGDWNKALQLCDSQNRAPILVQACATLEGDSLRALLADWWSTTEAWSGDPELRRGMMSALRKAAPVIVPSDDAGRRQRPPDGLFKVYRGNLGEKPDAGSWSLARETAEFFARMAGSVRGQLILGMSGPGPASIWQAVCDSDDVLGFFDDRGEYEIVTDRVKNVKLIATLEAS
jgi:hypothetical protein